MFYDVHLLRETMGLVGLPVVSFVAGLVYFYEFRKLVARAQHRRGPYMLLPPDLRKLLGSSRLWQQLYDILKLWHKQTIIPASARKELFVISPVVALICAIVSTWFLVIPGIASPLGGIPLSVILVFIVLFFIPVFWVLGAASSGSPWACVGARREADLLLAYEIASVSSIISVAVLAGDLTVAGIVERQQIPYLLLNPLAAAAFFVSLLGKLHLKPFDIPEANVEIVAGPFTEYSGKLLALCEISRVVLLFSLAGLFVDLFLAGGWASTTLLGTIAFFALVAVVVFFLALVSAAMPRYRIDQAVRFYTRLALVLSALALAWSVTYAIMI